MTAEEKLYAKLDKLNALAPEKDFKDLTDEDEEVLSAMQVWGMLSEEQMRGVVRELHRMKDDERSEEEKKIGDGEYGDADWGDEVSTVNWTVIIVLDLGRLVFCGKVLGSVV